VKGQWISYDRQASVESRVWRACRAGWLGLGCAYVLHDAGSESRPLWCARACLISYYLTGAAPAGMRRQRRHGVAGGAGRNRVVRRPGGLCVGLVAHVLGHHGLALRLVEEHLVALASRVLPLSLVEGLGFWDRVKPAPHPNGPACEALSHTDLAPGSLERWGALQAEALTMA
jgi:hypothetical protein